MRICFVCTGNICRSPMAALVFTTHAHQAGIDSAVTVTSAGVQHWHVGEPADRRAQQALSVRGYPTSHTARQISTEDLAADLIVALDFGHAQKLLEAGGESAKIRLLRSFDSHCADNLDVPDPYHGDEGHFHRVLDIIESAMPGLLQWVASRVTQHKDSTGGP